MPLPGTPLEEIDTPALVVDLDAAEANIKALQDWCDANGVNARPHVKTHKSPYWARKQIAAGAIGVCAAKVGEAEAMVAGGVTDILIANQIVGPIKNPPPGRPCPPGDNSRCSRRCEQCQGLVE